MIHNYQLKSSGPYPELTDTTPSPEIVSLLLDLYAGSDSELNAIMQYTYQHLLLHETNLDIANVLEEIAITEMTHLELLGEAIMAFGGTPYFINNRGIQYSTQNVFYCPNLENMLKKDLEDEKNAVISYTHTAQVVGNESLRNLLLRIAEDERLHAQVLSQLLSNLNSEMSSTNNNFRNHQQLDKWHQTSFQNECNFVPNTNSTYNYNENELNTLPPLFGE